MASEAGAADHPTSSEVNEVHEEVKVCEPEIISPAEVEKPEFKDSLPTPVVPLSESDDKIEAPINEELRERDEEENTRDEKLPTPTAPVADAEEKVEGTNFESSVVTLEKKAVEEEIPIVELEPTSEEKPKSGDISSAAVVLAEENQPLASEVFPSIEPELKAGDKNFEPSIVGEVKITSETHLAEEANIAAEPPLVEEKIIIEPFVVEEKLVQSSVTEEEKNTTEELVVEEKKSTETPVAEDKLVQTPVVEVAEDTIEELVVKGNSTTEIPVIEEAKITAEPPVVEENDVAKAPVVEAANHISEPFVGGEVKEDIHAPDVVSVENKSVVAQDCAAASDAPDVSEPEAKIVETNPVTDNSETPEPEGAKQDESTDEASLEAITLAKATLPSKEDQTDAKEEISAHNVPAHKARNLDEKVTLQDPPKEVVTVKSTQKQSNTILSKMKNTLVKAKKAITGKSANGKTPSLEPKGEIKV